ncbi:MAG: 7-carboxy-7-deazaguanine synthase QueE, partial [Planctomycetota bacterium]
FTLDFQCLQSCGHRPADLERLLDCVDVVMADIKIASSAGRATPPRDVRAFLRLAAQKECAVKVVVSARTAAPEVVAAARVAREEAPRAPFVLQPVEGARFDPPGGEHLLELQEACLRVHPGVRVIPQVHRAIHVR